MVAVIKVSARVVLSSSTEGVAFGSSMAFVSRTVRLTGYDGD